MDLQALKTYIDSIVRDGLLTLRTDDAQLPASVREFIGGTPQAQVDLRPRPGDGIRMEGDTLIIEGNPTAAWDLQGFVEIAFQLQTITVRITRPAPDKFVTTLRATGLLPLDDRAVPASLQSPEKEQEPWEVKLTQDVAGVSPLSALALGTGGPLPWRLPSNLDLFGLTATLPTAGFTLGFFPQTTFPFRYRFSLTFPDAKWEVLPGLLTISKPEIRADFAAHSLGCTVQGQFTLGTFPLIAGVSFTSRRNWSAFLLPAEGKAFPGIVAIAAAFAKDVKVEEGFAGIGFDRNNFDLAISRIAIDFDPFTPAFHYVHIDSILTIRGIEFFLSLRLPDFRFSGWLNQDTPIVVADWLASMGLDFSIIPKELTIKAIELEADTLAKYYSFQATVTQIWKLGQFSLEKIRLAVSYQGRGPTAVFTGLFECETKFYGLDFSLLAEYGTDTGWAFYGRAFTEKPLKIGEWTAELAKQYNAEVPSLIASIALKDVAVGYKTATNEASFGCIGLFRIAEQDCEAAIDLSIVPGSSKFTLSGELTMDRAIFSAALKVGDEKTLTLKAQEIDLEALLAKLLPDVTLPPELPRLFLEEASLDYNFTTGAFELGATAIVEWENPLGLTGESTTTFTIKASRGADPGDGKRPASLNISFTIEGPLQASPDLILNKLGLAFDYKRGESWTLDGKLQVVVLECPIDLKAKYTGEGKDRKIEIYSAFGTDGKAIFSYPEIFTLKASSFSLTREVKNDKVKWDLVIKSGLKLADFIDLNGELRFYRDGDKTEIKLAMDAQSRISLLLIPQGLVPEEIRLDVNAPVIAFTKTTGKWELKAGADFELKGLPAAWYNTGIVPRKTTVSLASTGTGISITVSQVTGPIDFDLPNFRVGDVEIPLGRLGRCRAEVRELVLNIAKEYKLTAQLWLGLPSKLNHVVFGEKEGKPRSNIFKTFDPDKGEDSMVKLEFGFGYIDKNKPLGIIFKLLSSPLNPINIKDGKWIMDLGDLGAADVRIPEFSLSTGGFSGKVGFKVTRPLRIPLKPIKTFLVNAKMDKLADLLPEYWPLMEMKFFDEQENLRVQEVANFLDGLSQQMFGKPLDAAVRNELMKIGEVAKRFPKAFKDYLNFEVPNDFDLTVSVTPDGGFDLDLSLGDRPLRILMPNMIAGIPCIQGLTISKFSFGTVMAGSLFSLGTTVTTDIFDLPSLIAALVIPPNDQLPPSRELHRQIIVDDFLMFIVYQTVVPIPIPLFYKRLGFSSLGPEGVEMKANVSFPRPTLNLVKALKMLLSFKKFIEDPNYKLPVKDETGTETADAIVPVLSAHPVLRAMAEAENDLEFELYDIYVKLPKWAGSAVLGKQGKIVSLSAIDMISRLLNAVKFFSLEDAIRTVELKYRVDSIKFQVFFLTVEAKWLLTTAEEFTKGAYAQLGLKPTDVDRYMLLLPEQGKVKGVVAFVSGSALLAGGEYGNLSVSMGIITLGAKGFFIQLSLEGRIKGIIDLRLKGELLYRREPTFKFLLKGDAFLSFAGLEVFKSKGEITFEGDRLDIKGEFELLKDFPFNVKGEISGFLDSQGLAVEGGVTAKLGLVVLVTAYARVFAHKAQGILGVNVSGTMFGAPLNFDLLDNNQELNAKFSMDMTPLATVNGFLYLQKYEHRMRALLIANVIGFGELKMEADATGPVGQLTVTHMGLPLVSGTSTSEGSVARLAGKAQLFPEGSPVNLTGDLTGEFRKEKFELTSQASFLTFLPGILSGGRIQIDQSGFSVQAFLLGQDAGMVKFRDLGTDLQFVVAVTLLGVLWVQTDLRIGKTNSGGSLGLTARLGDLELRGNTSLGMGATGAYDLFLLGVRLLGGRIYLGADRFELSGNVDFVVLTIAVSGSLSPRGIFLEGKTEFGIPNLPKFGIEIRIDNGLPFIRIWDPLNILNIKSKIAMFRGQLCFLAHWWAVGLSNHVAIGPNGVVSWGIAWWNPPDDWPSDVKLMQEEAVNADEAGIQDAEPLHWTRMVPELLFTDWTRHNNENIFRDPPRLKFLNQYQVHVEAQHPSEDRSIPLAVAVTLHKSPMAVDFFTEVRERMDKAIQEDAGLKMRVGSDCSDDFIDFDSAVATFSVENGTDNRTHARLRLSFRSPAGAANTMEVNYDFDNPPAAWRDLAAGLGG